MGLRRMQTPSLSFLIGTHFEGYSIGAGGPAKCTSRARKCSHGTADALKQRKPASSIVQPLHGARSADVHDSEPRFMFRVKGAQ